MYTLLIMYLTMSVTYVFTCIMLDDEARQYYEIEYGDNWPRYALLTAPFAIVVKAYKAFCKKFDLGD